MRPLILDAGPLRTLLCLEFLDKKQVQRAQRLTALRELGFPLGREGNFQTFVRSYSKEAEHEVRR